MLTPEGQVLLLTARTALNAAQQQHLARLLSAPLDWERLSRAAWGHGVAPLLHRHLRQQALSELVPEPVRTSLERWAHATAFRNLKLLTELRSFLLAGERAGLPVIVLKGAALAEPVYGHLGLRPMVDVDLLVPQQALPLAESVLEHLGYRPDFPHACSRRAWEHHYVHLAYRRPGAIGPVELHWDLVPPYPRVPFQLNVAQIWPRTQVVTIVQMPAKVLAGEDLLLYLSLHHFHHGGETLLGFCDVAEVIRRWGDRLSWLTLVRRAKEAKAARVVGYTLWWVREYLGAPVPSEVIATLCPQATIIDCWRQRLDGSPIPAAHLIGNPWARLGRQLLLLSGPVFRCCFVWQSLLPSASAFSRFHPLERSVWRYLYYLLRPTRLRSAGRYLGRLLGRHWG
ncbi:MAG TPA: hypothetical protein EYP85_10760 [Armatimonadetes bacterium]|nr:hypothetical protein [Armatimonadota bacterium]